MQEKLEKVLVFQFKSKQFKFLKIWTILFMVNRKWDRQVINIHLKLPNLLGNGTETMLDWMLNEKAPIIGKNNQSSSFTS